MKFVRFSVNSKISKGIIEQQSIKEVRGDIFAEWEYTGGEYLTKEVKFLAPLEPNQIIGIGANYVSKVEERPATLPDIPVFFFKPTSSVIGTDDQIVIPGEIEQVKFESELAVVIGKKAKKIKESEVFDYVFGYTVANDVTAPQYFHEAGQWTIGKAFDTFTPLGPVIETKLDPSEIRVKARVNDIEKQNSGTELLIVPIREMISYLSNVMTLMPGDVILTGSPLGAELIGAGDVIECEIKEIGTLKNSLVNVKGSVTTS
ncbi:ureidoglycolate lyase [Salipaludibacillus neizhouensis]|uniref:Ureidoglycolate lyase n=1 Tax=Salipaludibacillus neizhouensis TaxID=885475 RepID=A0A3A9K598_9BACI|nr:fumarylacetoacetate hydrolase family protein [Salipaludibacillus neizhouensis]RKL65531.1 ureidoglycolate lyase [Salipaludibacillus neizhouensis]